MTVILDGKDDSSIKLEQVQQKLTELQNLMMLDGMIASTKLPEIRTLLEEIAQGNTLLQILTSLNEMKKKLDRHDEQFNKLTTLISKMYQDNEINKDTFNKLDEFLKSYYDESNLTKDY